MLDMIKFWESAIRMSVKQKKGINMIVTSLEIKEDVVSEIK